MRYLNVSKARRGLAELIDLTERTVITKNGEPAAVLMSVEEYRSLVAARMLARRPEELSRILAAHRQVQTGDLSETRSLDAETRPDDEPAAAAIG